MASNRVMMPHCKHNALDIVFKLLSKNNIYRPKLFLKLLTRKGKCLSVTWESC